MVNNVKINLSKLVWLAVSLPGFSIVLCVFVSLYLHQRSSTATHCNVQNYLPSISAAVGSNTPEIYIFRICIGLHSFLRYGIAFVYYNFYIEGTKLSNYPIYYSYLVKINCFLNVMEVSGLIILTNVSSTENYGIHKAGFSTFVLSSIAYMLLTCYIFRSIGNMEQKSYTSLRKKKICLLTALVSLVFGAYFFWRHNNYCETGVYTLFALFEYCFVASNIGFHSTASVDFEGTNLEFTIHGVGYSPVKMSTRSV